MNSRFKYLLHHEWAELGVRWFLGTLFVSASYYKIISPGEFAKAIYSYGLFPDYSINLVAIIFPYFELLSGICLITGKYHRTAVLVILAMLMGFIALLSINLLRGHRFDCGCFSFNQTDKSDSGSGLLLRNGMLFVLAVYLLRYKGHRKWCLQKRKGQIDIDNATTL